MTLRLAFMGTPDFAVPTLAELLAQGHDIAAVYSQPPRPKGRGMALEPSPVHQFAQKAGLAARHPVSLKGEVEQAEFAALDLDAAIVVAYGLLLPKPILEAPRLGCFNLHASLLPRWRGAAPIQRAVMAGDEETGVMVMQMEEGLDTGPVLMAERVKIGRKTSGELTAELSRLGADLMVRALGALERGAVTPQPQTAEGVTYARKITKDEARIDWSKSAAEIDAHIRGLAPSPGAFTEAKGERLKILSALPVKGDYLMAASGGGGEPGEVITDDLTVACGEGALKLLKVQRAGKGVMEARELLKGFPLPPGTRFS
ncbi:MAG TPA: methionyl-tRNA formyltransferase [Rhizomicrobium sp.]|nr:methionyl-tRNA formyltransferase [Rhizomicrobium sp.]